jgi:hypothetical protein
MAVVRGDLAALRAAAHRYGGTVNDALLVAVTGAFATILKTRGESVDPVMVTVMVTARSSAEVAELGNAAAPVLVAVPASGLPAARLRRTAGRVRAVRSAGTATPVVAVLGPVFRVLAALGVYRWFLMHQRRSHTIVSNIHGPDQPQTLGGAPIRAIVPIGVGESGNLSVGFVAFSYAGALIVTIVADADSVPDLHVLAAALQAELAALATPPPSEEGCPIEAAAHGG